jgi:hypothetical protein
MSARRMALAAASLIFALGLGGCGEKEQVVVYKQGKYQGKADAKPWDNEPGASLYTTSKWNKGDQVSWETALRTRSQGQNEYLRAE